MEKKSQKDLTLNILREMFLISDINNLSRCNLNQTHIWCALSELSRHP